MHSDRFIASKYLYRHTLTNYHLSGISRLLYSHLVRVNKLSDGNGSEAVNQERTRARLYTYKCEPHSALLRSRGLYYLLPSQVYTDHI
jgi:hypothetical protein